MDVSNINLNIDSDALSRMVKDNQLAYLKAQGGTIELARKIGCENTDDGLGMNFNFAKQRERFGKNSLEFPPLQSYFSLLLEGAQDVIIIILFVAAVVSLVIGMVFEEDKTTAWIEGAAILLSIGLVLNVKAGTEYSKALNFRKQQESIENAKQCYAVRGGNTIKIHPREIVVGDVLRVSLGDMLQADGVLIDGFGIKMDESALTGESKLITKVPFTNDTPIPKDAAEKDKALTPFLLSGTYVMDGQGRMLVVAVGTHSLQGKILAAVNQVSENLVKTKASENEPKKAIENKADPANDGEKISVSIGAAPSVIMPPEVIVNNEDEPKKKGCCATFLTFGTSETGGTLMEKLGQLTMDIGKVGFFAAFVVLLFLVIRFSIAQYYLGGDCINLTTYNDCTLESIAGCQFNNATNICERVWAGARDANTYLEFFITAVVIIVVAVPDGLPLAVTLSLSISMRRMAYDNNQVKHLDSCETMGSATTICSDKTGTLTENRMTVMRVTFRPETSTFIHDAKSNIGVGNVVVRTGVPNSVSTETVKMLAEAIALNSLSSSSATETSPGTWKYVGNATECALLKLAIQLGYDPENIRNDKAYSPSVRDPNAGKIDWGVFSLPFSSSRKRMSWVVCIGSGYRLYTKGAPNVIFDACTTMHDPATGNKMPFDLKAFEKVVDDYSNLAMRAIALGYRDFPSVPRKGWDDPETEMSGITLLAVVGIEDPLRPTIVKAIEQCNKAGVDVRMCTGDSLPTAIAISKQCGILRPFDLDEKGNPKPFFAMTGAEFDERVHVLDRTKPKVLRRHFNFRDNKMGEKLAYPFLMDNKGDKVINQKVFDAIWPKLRVLARCQPEDKLTLVKGIRSSKLFSKYKQCEKLLKEHNIDIFPDFQVVAVTGDGTNDAPALKSADVGFAMGITGTDIAKQACDIVLLDDNFASIVAALKWGRNVYDAIAKFIQFQLIVNISAITIACVGTFIFQESPLRAVQMLWLNMIMDTLGSIALATEPPTDELLNRKPYGKKHPIVTRVMIINMLGQSAYQIAVIFAMLFNPQSIFGPEVEFYPEGAQYDLSNAATKNKNEESLHWSLIFHAYVLMTLANQINSRKLPTVDGLKSSAWEWVVFTGMHRNRPFVAVIVIEFVLQAIIIHFGGKAFILVEGISAKQWGVCLAFAVGAFLWQFVVFGIMVVTDPFFKARDERRALLKRKLTRVTAEEPEDKYLGGSFMVGSDGEMASGVVSVQVNDLNEKPNLTASQRSPLIPHIKPKSTEGSGKARERWNLVRQHVLYKQTFVRTDSSRTNNSGNESTNPLDIVLHQRIKETKEYVPSKHASSKMDERRVSVARLILSGELDPHPDAPKAPMVQEETE